jgi:phytoene dehydrogenase-like protein
MNGYRTEIFESNTVPGGLCAAWERGPYLFDGCLRWLVGAHPSSMFHRIWNELGAMAGQAIVDYDELLRFEDADRQVLSLSANLDQFVRDCRAIAPEDAALIDGLVRAARRCVSLDPLEKPLEIMSGLEKTKILLRYFRLLPVIIKWKSRSVADYLAAYRNPMLRGALMAVAGDGRMAALVLVMVLAFRSRGDAGYLVGGSRALAKAISRRYSSLGGVIRYGAGVVSVIVKNRRAAGVRCLDGTAFPAATVVSCADGYSTIFNLLGGRYVNKQLRYVYNCCDVFPGLIQASLGINRVFPEAPRALSLPLRPPLAVDDRTRHDRLEVAVAGSDSGLCPAGKSIMTVRLFSRWEHWDNLKRQNHDAYGKAKDGLLQAIIRILDQRFPGVASHLECADLATPATFKHYTGNWQGSFQGWLPTPRILGRRLPRTLPGLEGFYMAGHWVDPGGGLPWAALSGRYAAQMVCARDGKTFAAAES